MIDTINLTYDEYQTIINNIHAVVRENINYFNEIYKTDEIALYSYELAVGEIGHRMLLTFSYNQFAKILTCGIGRKDSRFAVFTADSPTFDQSDGSANFHIKYDAMDETKQMKWIAECHKMNTSALDVAADFAKAFWAINFYLRNLPETQEITKDKIEEVYLENKKGNKRYKSRVVLKRTIKIHAKPFEKKDIKRVIKCLCWGVRGHERHLRNGRAVWVKPYRKGKQRNNENAYTPKDYMA